MLHSTLRHYVFVHRFVEAVTWQPLRQALATRPLVRAADPHPRQEAAHPSSFDARAA